MSVETWLLVIAPIVIGAVSVIFNVIMLIRKNKVSSLGTIMNMIPTYISQAEKMFGAGNGTAKLQWVLTMVELECVKANIESDTEAVKEQIEKVLSTPQSKNEETDELRKQEIETTPTRTDIKE